MFIDEAEIYVKGGDGGRGCISFRREKFVPRGGPDGGDGGAGGSVILEANPNMRTLQDFRYRRHYKAKRGRHGMGKNMHGKSADDLLIKVPPGTIIKDSESGEILGDLSKPGQQLIVAKGGKGGRGNAAFATATMQAPRIAEPGQPGEERWIHLELKLLSDIGIIGFPNSGKSTLISRVSAAKPKIADYPFTTLVPHLGIVNLSDYRNFVMVDIPGIIPGAHKGQGLGIQFLRHAERVRVLLFLIDASPFNGRNSVSEYKILKEEIGLYSSRMLEKPAVVAANKIDLAESKSGVDELGEYCRANGIIFHAISALTGEGVGDLLETLYKLINLNAT